MSDITILAAGISAFVLIAGGFWWWLLLIDSIFKTKPRTNEEGK